MQTSANTANIWKQNIDEEDTLRYQCDSRCPYGQETLVGRKRESLGFSRRRCGRRTAGSSRCDDDPLPSSKGTWQRQSKPEPLIHPEGFWRSRSQRSGSSGGIATIILRFRRCSDSRRCTLGRLRVHRNTRPERIPEIARPAPQPRGRNTPPRRQLILRNARIYLIAPGQNPALHIPNLLKPRALQ